MNQLNGKRPVVIISACMRPEGLPDFAVTQVEISQEEYENGVHYHLTDQSLMQRGYEEPFVHFADQEAPSFLRKAILKHLVPHTNGAPQKAAG
jgi:hypothetical protein